MSVDECPPALLFFAKYDDEMMRVVLDVYDTIGAFTDADLRGACFRRVEFGALLSQAKWLESAAHRGLVQEIRGLPRRWIVPERHVPDMPDDVDG